MQREILTPSRKELAVLSLVAKGLSNIEAAERLQVSQRTTASHIQNLFNKTGCNSRISLVLHFVENGVLPPIGIDDRITRLELQIRELEKEKAETIVSA